MGLSPNVGYSCVKRLDSLRPFAFTKVCYICSNQNPFIMVHVFYFFGIFAIIWELLVISRPIKANRFISIYLKTEPENYSARQKAFHFWSFCYIVWTFVGLFTSQWPLFLALILISFVPKKFWALRLIDAVISFALLLFAVINQYHLHIDLFELIKSQL